MVEDRSKATLRESERLGALRQTELLDSLPEESFDRLTRLAARLLHAPIALVSLIDHDRQFFKSAVGLGEPLASARETPLTYSFCRHAVAARAPLIIPDVRDLPLVQDNLSIPEFGIQAYAGIPLISANGHALGTLCVLDTRPRPWTDEEVAILTDLAAAALTEIELRYALRAASRATEALRQGEERFRQTLAHAAHDLKSPLTAIKGFAQLIVRQLPAIESDKTARLLDHVRQIDTLATRLAVHLDELHAASLLPPSDTPVDMSARVDLNLTVREVVEEQQSASGAHTIVLDEADEHITGWWDRSLVERAVRNLIANAVKYSPDGGNITVTVRTDGDRQYPVATVVVADEGMGIPAADLPRIGERYFRAGNVPANIEGTGLGLSGVRQMALSAGGALEIDSTEGTGTTVTLLLGLQPPG